MLQPLYDPDPATRLLAVGGTPLLIRVLETWLTTSPPRIAAILTAAADGDLNQLGKEAHTLKSGSASIGLMRLATQAGEIERAARAGSCIPTETLAALQTTFEASAQHIRTIAAGH